MQINSWPRKGRTGKCLSSPRKREKEGNSSLYCPTSLLSAVPANPSSPLFVSCCSFTGWARKSKRRRKIIWVARLRRRRGKISRKRRRKRSRRRTSGSARRLHRSGITGTTMATEWETSLLIYIKSLRRISMIDSSRICTLSDRWLLAFFSVILGLFVSSGIFPRKSGMAEVCWFWFIAWTPYNPAERKKGRRKKEWYIV